MKIFKTVIEKIKSGRLPHDQSVFVTDCGTARCLAGWVAYFDEVNTDNPWTYCQSEYGLTDFEAELLFSPFATLEVQERVVDSVSVGSVIDLDELGKGLSKDSRDFLRNIKLLNLFGWL
jgi:hypothetical protein